MNCSVTGNNVAGRGKRKQKNSLGVLYVWKPLRERDWEVAARLGTRIKMELSRKNWSRTLLLRVFTAELRKAITLRSVDRLGRSFFWFHVFFREESDANCRRRFGASISPKTSISQLNLIFHSKWTQLEKFQTPVLPTSLEQNDDISAGGRCSSVQFRLFFMFLVLFEFRKTNREIIIKITLHWWLMLWCLPCWREFCC